MPTTLVEPSGSSRPDIYVVLGTQSPGDFQSGKAGSSHAWKFLKSALEQAGADLRGVRYAYANPYAEKASGKGAGKEQQAGAAQLLHQDILESNPASVIVCGSESVATMWPRAPKEAQLISNRRGLVIPWHVGGVTIPAVLAADMGYIQAQKRRDNDHYLAWLDDFAKAVDYAFEPDSRPAIAFCPPPEKVQVLTDFGQIKSFFAKLLHHPAVTFDWETTSLQPWPLKCAEAAATDNVAEPFSIAFTLRGEGTYTIPLYRCWPENMYRSILKSIGKWFWEAAPKQRKIAHNLKFDGKWALVKCVAEHLEADISTFIDQYRPCGDMHDTMLRAWLLDERPGASKLKVAAWSYLGISDWSVDVKNIRALPKNEVYQYNGLDAYYTDRLDAFFEERLKDDERNARLYYDLMLPATFAFLRTEVAGTEVDDSVRQELREPMEKRIAELEAEVRKRSGIPDLNLGSPQQLQKYFIEDCRYTINKRTATGGHSVDDEVLHDLAVRYNDKMLEALIEYRRLSKLNSTYVAGLDKVIHVDNKLHASFNITGTVTGRTSSSDPNLQNFPKRKDKQIRKQVIPPPGKLLASFDFGQLEGRLFGVTSGDSAYVKAIFSGLDIHKDHAIECWGEEGASFRNPVKTINFGTFYGGSVDGLLDQIDADFAERITSEDIGFLQDLLKKRYPGVFKWQEELLAFEREFGYVETLFGKRRRAPMGYNEKLNAPIQGTGSDMTVASMNVLELAYPLSVMIHDDLTFKLEQDEALEDHLFTIAEGMVTIPWLFMAQSPFCKEYVPMLAECSLGENWADLHEVFKISALEFGYDTMDKAIEAGIRITEKFGGVIPRGL